MAIYRYIAFAMLSAALCACSGNGRKISSDFDSIVYQPEYASGFTLTAQPGAKSVMLSAICPWQNADSATVYNMLLLRDGETAPADFSGTVLDGDIRRIVTMSTTQIAMLDAVGAAETVAGVSGLDYVSNVYVRGRLDESADVGYEGNVDYERLAALDPDLVLLYGVSGPSVMEAKLDELGIPYFYIGDYVEESPLGKAEWLVPVGEIVGRRDSAERVFAGIKDEYTALLAKVGSEVSRPKVMINMPYSGSWFMPSSRSYVARLIEDAGGDYIYKENDSSGSVPVDVERAYILADSADVWINTGSAENMAELLQALPKFADVKPVRTGRVFNCTARVNRNGGNDYFESGTVWPQRVLADMIAIFHPETSCDSMYYYRCLR